MKFSILNQLSSSEGKTICAFYIHSLMQDFLPLGINMIRRTLYTSFMNPRIIAIKSNFILSEVSFLLGLREPLIEFLANLNLIEFYGHFKGSQIGTLCCKGPLIMVAGYIQVLNPLMIVNPNLYLGVLNNGFFIDLQLAITLSSLLSSSFSEKTFQQDLYQLQKTSL